MGFFLSFANVYVGLKTGWFIGVNLTACILAFALGSSLHKAGIFHEPLSILEMNAAVSTASSAGYATGNMIISAIPAMLLLSVTDANPGGTHLPRAVIALWILLLALLGVTLAIPMKRNMINRERLKFPSGTAAALMLYSLHQRGAEAVAKARALFVTAGLAALVPLAKDLALGKNGAGLLPSDSKIFDGLASAFPALMRRMTTAGSPALHPDGRPFALSDYHLRLDHGVALIFAGILVGLRVTIWMVAAGLVLVFWITPMALDVGATSAPGNGWKEIGLWIGAPLLVASGLVSFVAQWRAIIRALSGFMTHDRAASTEDVEVPTAWFVSGLAVSGIGIVVLARLYFEIPVHFGALAIAMTFLLALVACRVTGETDITPGSVLGKITQLTYGVLIPQSTSANLQTAAITSGATIASADLLNDLKAGYLLGANPRKQFLAQAAGVFTGAIASTLAYSILVPSALAISGTPDHPPAFPAVGAQQWKAVAEVLRFGAGNLHPMAQHGIVWGAALGVVLTLAETMAPAAYRKWMPSPTGLGLGLVLPFPYPLAMLLGALGAEVVKRVRPHWADRCLIPIAAGGIAGESIMGVVVQTLNNFVLR